MLAGKPVFVRLTLLGIAMILATAVIILTAVVFEPDAIFFALANAIPALIVGAAVYFWRPWGLIVGILGGVLVLLFFGPDAPISLASPNSFYDFAVSLFTLVGGVMILVGSIGGLVQHFQHKESFEVTSTQRSVALSIVGVVALLSVVSLIVTLAGIGGVSAADEQGATIVTAKKSKYDVSEIRASSSGTTKIVVKNKDPFQHTFTVEDLNIDVKIGPGSEKLIEVKSPGAGTHYFFCTITGHEEDMHGDIVAQ